MRFQGEETRSTSLTTMNEELSYITEQPAGLHTLRILERGFNIAIHHHPILEVRKINARMNG